MGSLFDVSPELMLVLTLAASDPSARPSIAEQPAAVARTSEAYGLSEQAWLKAVEQGAGGEELVALRGAIFKTSSGRYYAPSADKRASLAALRGDPAVTAAVAFDLAGRNADALEKRLGHQVSAGDLYIAQALGVDAAAGLIAVAEATPSTPATEAVPGLERDTPLARTSEARLKAGQLYKKLTQGFTTMAPTQRIAAVATPRNAERSTTASNARSDVRPVAPAKPSVGEPVPRKSKDAKALLPPFALKGPAIDNSSVWTAVENRTHVGWATELGE